MRVIVTGVGSVMGYSILDALSRSRYARHLDVVLTNSDERVAARYRTFGFARQSFERAPLASSPSYLDFLVNLINSKQSTVAVFPGTQHELGKLAKLRDEGYPIASNGSALTDLFLDKRRTFSFLTQSGVPMATTFELSQLDQLDPTRVLVAKPSTGSASRGVMMGTVQQIQEGEFGLDTIFQEKLEGPEFTCSLYKDRLTESLHILALERVLTEDGASWWGKVVPSPTIEDYLRLLARQLAPSWDYGHLNVQLILSPGGPLLFEVNPRLSSTEGPKASLGFNTAEAYLENLKGRTCSLVSPSKGEFIRYYSDVVFG
jgi:carbamoyl-phosphate synthase large subunit